MLEEYFYISRKELMSKIDQIKVWESLIGTFEVGKQIINPFRIDNSKGSCMLYWTGDVLRLIDFADRETHGLDCIGAYMKNNPNLHWNKVCSNLLNLTNINLVSSSYRILPGIQKIEIKYELFKIQPTQRHIDYWSKRGVDLTSEERLVCIEGFKKIKGEQSNEVVFGDMCFAYLFDSGRVKMYYPERSKPRFEGNANSEDIWIFNRGDSNLIIIKAHKDSLVLKNLCNNNILVTQNEIPIIPLDIMFQIESGHTKIYIWFDNDKPGIEGAEYLKKQFVYIPVETIRCPMESGKDLDEMYINNGRDYCLNFIKSVII